MDNFQLNNTSIYLSGQCKWDIILNKEGSGLKINGFQLTPVSNNIPFNKRGEVQQLNDYHSDTIKRFFEDIKENFWSTATSYSYYTDNNDTKVNNRSGD